MAKPRPKKQYSTDRNYKAVGEFLQAARERNGYTQKDVSEILNITGQMVSNYESGMAVPPLKKLSLFLQLYNLNPEPLLEIILEAEREVMLKSIASGPKLKRLLK